MFGLEFFHDRCARYVGVVGLLDVCKSLRLCLVLRAGFLRLERQHQFKRILATQGTLDRVDDELRFGHTVALGSLLQLLFKQGAMRTETAMTDSC